MAKLKAMRPKSANYKGQLLARRGNVALRLGSYVLPHPYYCENPPASELGLVLSGRLFDKDYKRTHYRFGIYIDIHYQSGLQMHFLSWRKESDNGFTSTIMQLLVFIAALTSIMVGMREAMADAKEEVIGEGVYKMLNHDNYVEAWTKEKADETPFWVPAD